MLRESSGRPIGDWFIHHGTDVETRWTAQVPLVTPVEQFFVRNHTAAPAIDADTWRLRVTGDGVRTDATFSLADLAALPILTREHTLECAGNGRRLFGAQQHAARPGTQWDLGAIGAARWTGVPLSAVLERAGLRQEAVQVMAVGLDDAYSDEGVDYGRVRRPLPIAKALDDVLVVWEMNGEPLPPDHGFPVRLIVPGWVGIASIKWLGELRVTTTAEESPWTSRWYRMHGPAWTGERAVMGRMPVKSDLDPTSGLRVGTPATLRGRAWSGEATITRVEVSVDAGRTWRDATRGEPADRSTWTPWELAWTPPSAGRHEVRVRATDSDGRTQPDVAEDNDDGYFFDAVVRREVLVEETD